MPRPDDPPTDIRSRPPRVALVDLGCAKNTVDSESALGDLLSTGFDFAADPEDADLLLVNTCAFIEDAREESVEHLLAAIDLKETHPDLRVVAMGCMGERYGAELAGELPDLDGVFDLSAYATLPDLCARVLSGERVVGPATGTSATLTERPRLLLGGDASAWLRIADGCDNRCAYCAVPDIRGPVRSRPREAILDEARRLVAPADDAPGVRELCVIAQDIGAYGTDRGERNALARLLRDLLALPGEPWIRLLYMHPAHLDDAVVDLLAGEERLLRYLDLPVQHVSENMLSRMGRRIAAADQFRLLDRLHERVPGLVLRTSIICGFPGETDADVDELLACVREGRFQHLGAFVYSPEEGTPAAEMDGRVARETAEERRAAVMEAQQTVAFAWRDERLGKIEQVLLETELDDGCWAGRTRAEAPEIDGTIHVTSVKNAGVFHVGSVIPACLRRRDGYDIDASAP